MKKKKKNNKFIFLALILLALFSLEDETQMFAKPEEKPIDVDLAITTIQAKAQDYDFQKTGRMEKIIKNYPL